MIGPPVTAYLLTDDLKRMLILSGVIGAVNGISGYQAAAWLDVSIAGSMAVMTGIVFLLVFVFAPHRGFVSALRRRKIQKIRFSKMTLLFHLYNHEGSENEAREAGLTTIQTELHWDESFTKNVLALLKKEDYIEFADGVVKLTERSRIKSIHNYEALFSRLEKAFKQPAPDAV